jgi:hypothetical protein
MMTLAGRLWATPIQVARQATVARAKTNVVSKTQQGTQNNPKSPENGQHN